MKSVKILSPTRSAVRADTTVTSPCRLARNRAGLSGASPVCDDWDKLKGDQLLHIVSTQSCYRRGMPGVGLGYG
jgi:hypothetical protein